jgi:hypothetical protein
LRITISETIGEELIFQYSQSSRSQTEYLDLATARSFSATDKKLIDDEDDVQLNIAKELTLREQVKQDNLKLHEQLELLAKSFLSPLDRLPLFINWKQEDEYILKEVKTSIF